MKPFLKWAGNKYQIIDRIKAVLPVKNQGRLIEPFLGSGAVFLNTDFNAYLLSDNNHDLINLYQCIQQDGKEFIDYCSGFFQDKNNADTIFYEYRQKFNETADTRLKSALFVYLNKHAYNGLCRYNSSGKFNTPFGKYKKPYFPEKEMLYFHQKSQQAIFKNLDFMEIMHSANPGDIVYCDPPYAPLSKTANFTSYSVGAFGEEQQRALAHTAQVLQEKDIRVIISNRDIDFTQAIYKSARDIITFEVQRFISCKGDTRIKAKEMLAVF